MDCCVFELALDFVACGKVKVWSVKRKGKKKDGEGFLQPLVQKVAHSCDTRRTHFSKKCKSKLHIAL
jgi:hypothetical protein